MDRENAKAARLPGIVISEPAEGVMLIRIDRPHRLNALAPQTFLALRAAFAGFRDHPGARVAVVTGTGDRGFCTGADLKETLPPQTPFAASVFAGDEAGILDGNYIRGLDLDRLQIGKPVIAAINGHALGGGLELALACDIRMAAPNATFGLPEVRSGSIPAVGGIQRLMRTMAHSAAMTMILTGEAIDAKAALAAGLVSQVVPLEELLPQALALAGRIAANAPLAVKAARMLARDGLDMPIPQAMQLEQFVWGTLRETHDRVEGRRAFAEKRAPRFTGR
ncbi:enoyl-CoA hydratase/isomerase family protein [Xanthobacter pseudotagetidis]|uniref:enoyl-CoA hydratase/isomerase family protein n=1 Tax=Xanthobacter pseudotagetidis TaxID=3119911 RepID=UPI003726F16F